MSVDYWVYKVRDSEMALIYVGMTRAGPRRLAAHSKYSRWAPLATTIEIEHLPDRTAALDRERELIREHCPRFNLSSNPEAYPLEPGEMSIATVARRTHASTTSIRRAIREGSLRARRGPRGSIVHEDDWRDWVEGSPV